MRRQRFIKSLIQFLAVLLLIFTIRWALIEPYIIPSGSMLPQLLVYDHIFVNKTAFGLRVPFSDRFIKMWNKPQRGEIVVFHSIEDEKFLVKRVIGLPGDRIEVDEKSQVTVNGKPLERAIIEEMPLELEVGEHDLPGADVGQEMYQEHVEKKSYITLQDPNALRWKKDWTVPAGHYFMMGDNRDHSYDSRFWGYVPEDHLIGRVTWVWLSCNKTLPQAPFICDPLTFRWSRLFHSVN